MPQNVVGPKVRKFRYEKGWSQDQFAARCQRYGLDISRGTVAKIESQVRCVSDAELFRLARTLGVSASELDPSSRK